MERPYLLWVWTEFLLLTLRVMKLQVLVRYFLLWGWELRAKEGPALLSWAEKLFTLD